MLNVENQTIEITNDQVKSWCPMFGLPCYDNQLTEPFFMSMIKASMAFKEIGMRFSISTISDSLINRARNQLVAKFMANKEFTHLFFIDVDISFNHEDILKMLWHDKEIMTGAYPIKDINWEKIAKNSINGMDPKDLLKNATRFVVNPVKVSGSQVRVENGALSVYDAGTGFMCISRSAFEKLFEAHPELKYVDDTGTLHGEEKEHAYALFNSYVDPDTKRFLSEDYGFCRYWQDLGGEIWTDPSVELGHLGRLKYSGRLIDFLIQMSAEQSTNKS